MTQSDSTAEEEHGLGVLADGLQRPHALLDRRGRLGIVRQILDRRLADAYHSVVHLEASWLCDLRSYRHAQELQGSSVPRWLRC